MDTFDEIFDGTESAEVVEEVNTGQDDVTNVNADDLDDIFGSKQTQPEENKNQLIDSLMKARGLTDKVTILDEEGKEEEVDFYSLPLEEQLQILSPEGQTEGPELDNEEIELLNIIRENDISPSEFLQNYKEAVIKEYIKTNGAIETQYQSDLYGDNELFLYDLKNRFDLTDEEQQAELEKELANPETFKKKVDRLRVAYKAQEDAENEAKAQADLDDFTNVITGVASKNNEFHGILLEDQDKVETLSYILDVDDSGVSKLAKDLNDPNKLYEVAWYLRYGKEAFEALESAYEQEIANLKKKGPVEPAQDKKTVVKTKPQKKPISSIHDLN